MKNKGLFYSLTLLCLLIAQRSYSLTDSTRVSPDSIKVPIASIYYYNAVADSLDFCKEDKETLLKAVNEAKKSISERDMAIKLLESSVMNNAVIDHNNQVVIREKDAEIRRQRGIGWKKLALGVLAGFLTGMALK